MARGQNKASSARGRRNVPATDFAWTKSTWIVIAIVFAVGLGVRIKAIGLAPNVPDGSPMAAGRWAVAPFHDRLESDERLYVALVEQLDAGHGYTLHGHPVLDEPWVVRSQYDHPLFFHPPAGPALFWIAHKLIADAGYALVELASFAIFFWSVILMSRLLMQPFRPFAAVLMAIVTGFTPIMTHVVSRLWLDGPLLAATTAASALFLFAATRRQIPTFCLAGVLLGVASLIKITAFLAAPGLIALGWTITPPDQRRRFLISCGVFIVIAAVIQLPWELWQWRVVGSPFPEWAGRPVPELVRTNAYIKYLTEYRSPWVYVSLLPQVLWTLVPALILFAALYKNDDVRQRGLALLLWLAIVVGVHVALGAIGYSKLLRYVVLVTPAEVLLVGLCINGALAAMARRSSSTLQKGLLAALLLVMLTGIGLELAQSLKPLRASQAKLDLIVPLTGLPGLALPN